MTLPRLNPTQPQYNHARGVNPPIVRAMMHIGYAVAIANVTPEEDWADVHRLTVVDEITEARNHLEQSALQGFDPNPFLSRSAITQLNELKTQFDMVLDSLSNPEISKNEMFTDLTVLADNAAYISALAENFVIGNGADEGRNP